MRDSIRRVRLAAVLALSLLATACATPAEGQKAPPLQGSGWITPPGKYEFAERYPVKGRWTLIVFFETSAEACATVVPEAIGLLEKYGARGLVGVGVTPRDREDTEKFLEGNPLPFPILTRGQPVLNAYGIPRVSPAHAYLVDPEGIVVVQDDLAVTADVLERHLK